MLDTPILANQYVGRALRKMAISYQIAKHILS